MVNQLHLLNKPRRKYETCVTTHLARLYSTKEQHRNLILFRHAVAFELPLPTHSSGDVNCRVNEG